jgi:hypothetical protein
MSNKLSGIARDFEFAGDKVEHGDLILLGTVAAGLAFDRREQTVESFQKGSCQSLLPMGQDPCLMSVHPVGGRSHRFQ